jgi:beta-N-acetylhexosaminidase
LTISIIFCSCAFFDIKPDQNKTAEPDNKIPKPSATNTPNPKDKETEEAGIQKPIDNDEWSDIESLLSGLTLEEKIGQMFFIGLRKDVQGNNLLKVDEFLENWLREYKPGGFIIFSENLDTIWQAVSFINDIKKTAKIPIFIGIDEEGGIVSRLNKAGKLHSTLMPEPFLIGKTNNTDYAYLAAKVISKEIKSLGFNLNFAPVADIFSNPKNRVIGRRAYSDNAEIASGMVEAAVKGMKDSGIIPVLKHFPGHGDTLEDSHTGAAIVENDLDRLNEFEFKPFIAGIEAGAEMVMTAHVLTPKITGNNLPATLSKTIIQDILRKNLGFEGVIITDGLEMSAISAFFPEEEAVILAIEAGVDMLLLPKDFENTFKSVLNAVKSGRISEDRINRSVRRILMLKSKTLRTDSEEKPDPEKVLGSSEHLKLAEKIRKDSVK